MNLLVTKARDVVQHYIKTLQALFTIPPLSESMAGVIILFVFMNSMATSIWMFNAWTPFVYLLFNKSNVMVGIVSGVNGVAELVFALISGHVADKIWGPSRTLSFAVRFGVVNLCVVTLAVWSGQRWLLIVAQIFEGCYMGLSFTCVESVFAQCLRNGERDRLYSIKFSVESSGPIIGLISSILLFLVAGDNWTTRVLQIVMTCGLALHLASMLTFLYLFKPLPSHLDEAAAAAAAGTQKASDVVITGPMEGNGGSSSSPPAYEVEEKRVMDVTHGTEDNEEEELTVDAMTQNANVQLMNCARTSILRSTDPTAPRPLISRYEPSVCTARNDETVSMQHNTTHLDDGAGTAPSIGDRVSTAGYGQDGDGSTINNNNNADRNGGALLDLNNIPPGAHVEYVDHEFEEATGWRKTIMRLLPLRIYPVAVVVTDMVLVIGSGMTTQYFSLFMMSVYHVSPAAIAALNLFNSVIIAFLAIFTGTMGRRYGRVRAIIPPKLLGATLLLYMALAQRTVYGPRLWMCVAYVFRNAFMNCSAGLSRALIMDLVPRERHSRWNALESVQSAGWSGTAILGGVMADNLGYGAAFIFTFFFHFLSTSALIPFAVRNDSRLPEAVLIYDSVAPGAEEKGKGKLSTDQAAQSPQKEGSEVVVAELTAENVRKIASCVSLYREDEE